MFRFEELEIWKLSVEYANKLYNTADAFPQKELYALGSQLRRAGVSVPSNIAEGSGATTVKDFQKFLDIAIKSALETVSLLYIAQMRNYTSEKERQSLYGEIELIIRKIRAFKKTLR